MTTTSPWTPATEADLGEILAGLRHRLANAAAPLGVLVEMLDDDLDDDLVGASRRSVGRLERLLGLIGVLAGRSTSTGPRRAGVTVTLDIDEMVATLTPLVDLVVSELAPDAAAAGATRATLSYRDGILLWHDDGAGFPAGVVEHLGTRQPAGEHGCGMGLAAVCSVARRFGLRTEARNDEGAQLRFLPTT